MQSFLRYHLLAATWPTLFVAFSIIACNTGQKSYGDNANFEDSLANSKLKHVTIKYAQGKDLFKSYCKNCHFAPESNVSDQTLFHNLFDNPSPYLESYFVNYIKDSKKLKQTGDKRANLVESEFRSDYEHNFRDSLSSSDIDNIIIYIKVALNQAK